MKTGFEFFLLLILPCVVYSYRDLRCPTQSEWIFRSSWVCNETDIRRYICLYNAINLMYEESCKFEPVISGNGSQYVIRVYPNPEDCRNHQRYQPFPLGSNVSSDCVFRKSKCSDEGQILFHPGSSEKDITCRCDFEKGYGFVNRTQRKCECLPSKEDCSCYLKRNQCLPRHRLISDFTCLHEENRNYINECPGMGPVSPKKNTPPVQQLSKNELKNIGPLNRLTDINMIAGFVIACILYALCALFCIILNKLPDRCYIDIRPYNLDIKTEGCVMQISWSAPDEVPAIDILSYNLYYVCKGEKKKININGFTYHVLTELLPRETYTFAVSVCLKNSIESKCTKEKPYRTGIPKKPKCATTYAENRSIVLCWESPSNTFINIEEYLIHISTDEWKSFDTVLVNALRYTINKVTMDVIYRFKIFACSNSVKSDPEPAIFTTRPDAFTTGAHFVGNNLKDKDLVADDAVAIVNKVCNGNVLLVNARKGSVVVEITFISEGFTDEKVLHETLKNAFETRMSRLSPIHLKDFWIKRLNAPNPPRSLSTVLEDGNLVLKWKSPGEGLFKADTYNILYRWNGNTNGITKVVNATESSQIIPNIYPAETYTFTITSCSRNITGNPSEELEFYSGAPNPPRSLSTVLEDGNLVLKWKSPEEGLFKADTYNILYRWNGNTNGITKVVNATESSQIIPNIYPAETYTFTITSCSRNITGNPCEELEFYSGDALEKEEEENYKKLSHLVHDVAFSSIKKKFEREYTQLDIEKMLNEHPSHLSLTDEQMRILYSQSDTNIGRITTIINDMELMMDIILKLNKCPKDQTKQGFQLPKYNEHGDIAELQRVEFYRRALKNNQTYRIPKAEFDKGFSTVTDTIKRIDEENVPDLQQLQSKLNVMQGHTLPNQEHIINISKHQTEIDATVHVFEENQTKGSDTLDFHQLIIDTWEIENERFKKTKVVDDILLSLEKTNCITITGMPGEGKTALMHHVALVLHKKAQFSIVPCSVATDINHFYKKDKNQIFVIDDVCGKYIIDQHLVNSFIYNESFHRLILKKGNSKFISTCRKQIFQEKKFQQLQYLIGTSFDISTDFPMSVEEKLLVANEYLSANVVEKIKGRFQSYSFFPLMCRLCHENPPTDILKFFDNPFGIYTEELDKLLLNDRRKLCALFLIVVFNGTISKDLLSEDILADFSSIAQTRRSIFANFRVDISFLLETLDIFLNTYFRKAGDKYLVIHDKLFDFLCSYFGEKCQKDFIQYADIKILVERSKLKSLLGSDNDDDDFSVLIHKQNEDAYFQRIINEISKGNVHDVLCSEHIENRSFRRKFIIHLQKLEKSYVKKLATVKEKVQRFENTSITANTPLSVASYRGYNDLVDFFLKKYIDDLNDENVLAAFNMSCIGGHVSLVHSFIECGIEVNKNDDKRGWTPLMHTCDKGHVSVAKLLIENGSVVNKPNSRNTTPLMIACLNKKVDVVHVLISEAAEVNKRDNSDCTPLIIACHVGSVEIVQCLINSGADVNMSFQDDVTKLGKNFALMMSNLYGEIDKKFEAQDDVTKLGHNLQLLMRRVFGEIDDKSEATNSGWTALHIASTKGFSKIAELLITKGAQRNKRNSLGLTSLMLACLNGHEETVQLLLNSGCDPNMQDVQGRSALTIACRCNKTKIAMMLISKKVQINNIDVEKKIPLHYACKNGNPSIVDILLKEQSNVNSIDESGHSPFYEAVEGKDLLCLKRLILKGANIYKADQNRFSPLHKAAFEGFEECVTLIMSDLTKTEKDIDRLDEHGLTPLMYSCKRGHMRIVEILILHGAVVNYIGKSGYTPLTLTCESNNIEITSLLLTKGATVDLGDVNGCTPLKIASKGGYTEIASLLIENNADINRADKEGWTPLHFASFFGHTTTIDLLIAKGARVDQYDTTGCTPLMSACQRQLVSVVEKLLLNGANPNHSSADGNTPVTTVCKNGKLDILNILMLVGADLEKPDKKGKTPLRLACDAAQLSAVEMLIDNGSDVNSCDTNGMSPLNALCIVQEDRLPIIQILIDSKCYVDVPDDEGYTPLMRACTSGNIDVVYLLIKAGSNIIHANHNGWTALLVAYMNNQERIATMLIASGASVMVSSLFSACASGDLTLTKVITARGVNINEMRTDGLTPLMVACKHNQHSVVDFLVKKKAFFNKDMTVMNRFCEEYDKEGHNVLTNACLNEHTLSIQLLIENGADPSFTDKEGWSPITRACFNGQIASVLCLINHGVDINQEDRNRRTPFLVAVKQSNIDIAELLIKSGLREVSINKLDDEGMTPLMNACKSEGRQLLIRFLLSKGADVNTVGKNDLTAVKVACEAENWECLELLLENDASFIKDCPVKKTLLDNSKVLITACKDGLKYVLNEFLSPDFNLDSFIIDDDFTLLMHACSKGNDEIVHTLCNKGADVNRQNKNGLFPLMIAIRYQYINTVTLLINHCANSDLQDNNGFTPLMFACQEGMTRIVKTLVSLGANTNISVNQMTPLSIACKQRRYEVVDFLLEIGVNVSSTCRSELIKIIQKHNADKIDLFKLCCRKGYRAMASYFIDNDHVRISSINSNYLIEACTFGHESVVSKLIDKGAGVNKQNQKGETAVLIACDNCYISILEQLIESDADINIADSNGYTPLHKACINCYIDIVRLLITKNANVNKPNKNGVAPLQTACTNGFYTIVELLTESEVEIDKQDNEGWTALMSACQAGQYAIVVLLVQQGASINISEGEGYTALAFACFGRFTEIIGYLINNGADVNKANDKKCSPLHYACGASYESLLKQLILRGGNIDQPDHEGWTPLMIACTKENSRIIPILINNGANVDNVNKDGHTPLRIACDRLEIENVRVLMNAKANAMKEDSCGDSSLHAVCNLRVGGEMELIESLAPFGKMSMFFSFGMEFCKFVEAFKTDEDQQMDIYNTKACEIVSLLITSRPDVNGMNKQGYTVLMLACKCGLHTVAEVLIKNGADLNIVNKRGETAFSLACANANYQSISVLLNGGAEIDIVNKDGDTPLTFVCKGNITSFWMSCIFQSFQARSNADSTDTLLQIIKLLLSRNADVNKPTHDGWTPLMVACKWQKADVVFSLLDNGACIETKNNIGENALSIACKNGRLKTVGVLLEQTANPNSLNDNGISPLKQTCDILRSSKAVHFETSQSLMSPKMYPLSETVMDDSIIQDVSRETFEQIAQCLIDNSAKIDMADIEGWTPLMSACRGGLKNVAEMLIDHGADIDAAANDGLTVLMLACMSGNTNVVDLIIDRSKINERDGKGWSALKYACKLGHTIIVNTLLKHKADVNQHDIEGWSPLMSACQHGYEEIVNLLLKYGAIANWYSNDRCHPLKLAKVGKYDRIESILVEYGAITSDQEDE